MKYNFLTVIKELSPIVRSCGRKRRVFLCRCGCGIETVCRLDKLKEGRKKSCGCGNVKHGLSKHPLYNIWKGMVQRCMNPSDSNYRNYGGRGVSVCERWFSVKNFVDDMGERPDGCSIDRIDNNGNYDPSNCRWATPRQQARNTRVNRKYKGKCLVEWAEETGISHHTIRDRLDKGWGWEDALKESVVQKSELRLKVEAAGLSFATVKSRINRGWVGDELLLPPTEAFRYKGKTAEEWSRELGRGKNFVSNRLARGWSWEKAIKTLPPDPERYQGKTALEWSRELGFSDGTVDARLRRGLSWEEAVKWKKGNHQEKFKKEKKKRRPRPGRGPWYEGKSWVDWADELGMDWDEMRLRAKRNCLKDIVKKLQG